MLSSTEGNWVSAFTLGSHDCSSTAFRGLACERLVLVKPVGGVINLVWKGRGSQNLRYQRVWVERDGSKVSATLPRKAAHLVPDIPPLGQPFAELQFPNRRADDQQKR